MDETNQNKIKASAQFQLWGEPYEVIPMQLGFHFLIQPHFLLFPHFLLLQFSADWDEELGPNVKAFGQNFSYDILNSESLFLKMEYLRPPITPFGNGPPRY
ncbi:hypothetical protein DRN48_03230 [Thermococci archaeon]|nr:MAG: hypothetical protein DRN48_03230 [Thermococci archaeon]